MKIRLPLFLTFCMALLPRPSLLATGQQVRFSLAVHSEAPGGGGSSGVPATPDFRSADKATYLMWRAALLDFAAECHSRSIDWQFQSDWNFLEGVVRFETPSGSGYDSTMQTLMSDTTGGVNVVKYLHETLGVNLDPHSHETMGYNYADVAYLIDVKCDTRPSSVVGGHIYDPGSAGFQNWPKFLAHPLGLKAQNYAVTNYRWRPQLLMGGGSASHTNDPHVAGLWRPQDADHYFTHSAGQTIAAVGNWEQDFFETDRLLGMLENDELPHGGKLWTVGRVLNHRDLVQTGYIDDVAIPVLDTIAAWRDAGRFQVRTFEAIYNEWTAPPYSGGSSLYQRPVDNITFSLNWQDFCYTAISHAELRTLLNLHESQRVPVDVFLTTWQTDILEDEAPELLGRLFSSRWVNLAYHVRAPKPYANNYTWQAVTSGDIAVYESSHLNMITGQPVPGTAGGFEKLSALYGSAPRIVGPNADNTTRALVHDYFRGAGAEMIVEHDVSGAAVNFGTATSGLHVRPENYDWKLIELYRGDITIGSIDQAFSEARLSTGSVAPYFVGVKLHDNDLFADRSAWGAIYQDTRRAPDWDPFNPSLWSTLIADTIGPDEPARRRNLYIGIVNDAASRRASLNLMDARDTLSMLGDDAPRPIGLSLTEVAEDQPPGSVLAQISGGGVESGLACSYTLADGPGDADNGDFAINGGALIAKSRFDHESAPVKHLRLRWEDDAGHSGQRAMTMVVANVDTDDDDGDGLTEAQELVAGTDPQDSTSRLAVSSAARIGSQMTLSWQSVPGRHYVIQRATTLTATSWTDVTATLVTATLPITTRIFTDAAPGPVFYRVAVVE